MTGTGSDANTNDSTPFWSFSVHAPSTTSAVLEPETYAMMMAGLGLAGFASHRKTSK